MLKEEILKYSGIIHEEKPASLINYFRRTIFNKPLPKKQSDFTALGGNIIKAAKANNDLHLRDDKGGTITKVEFKELIDKINDLPTNSHTLVDNYLNYYSDDGELL